MHTVVKAFEKPTGHNRKEQQNNQAKERYTDNQPYPECASQLSSRQFDHDGKHQKGQGIGNNGAADCYIDRLVFSNAEFADDRVENERVRGKDTADKNGG